MTSICQFVLLHRIEKVAFSWIWVDLVWDKEGVHCFATDHAWTHRHFRRSWFVAPTWLPFSVRIDSDFFFIHRQKITNKHCWDVFPLKSAIKHNHEGNATSHVHTIKRMSSFRATGEYWEMKDLSRYWIILCWWTCWLKDPAIKLCTQERLEA